MEALKLKIENLQFEMTRLDVENKKLREQNPEESKVIDWEAELEHARDDVARLISRFDGDDLSDRGAFQDWIEQFKSVASLWRWDDHYKLVNLTARLRGAAYSFYRSCTPAQRSDYRLLVDELKKRFTPVKLPAVQSQLFHEREQGPRETADEFAEDLKKLYARAYTDVSRGGPEAERIGQSVLANQFITGLRPDLKGKVVGMEGTLDQLLLKTRFEEAKKRELAAVKPHSFQPKPNDTRTSTFHPPLSNPTKVSPTKGQSSGFGECRTCYNCGMTGHLSRQCQYPRQQRKDREAVGRKDPTISHVRSDEWSLQEKVTELRRELHAAEIEMAADDAVKDFHDVQNVTSDGGHAGTTSGPTVMAKLEVNGVKTEALVDTGSPVTIVSLAFAMHVLSKDRGLYSSVEEWKQETIKKFSEPTVNLRNYGGLRLNVSSQVQFNFSQGEERERAIVLVQKDAPHQVLLGTDLQPQLGISLVIAKPGGAVDLLTGKEWPTAQPS